MEIIVMMDAKLPLSCSGTGSMKLYAALTWPPSMAQ